MILLHYILSRSSCFVLCCKSREHLCIGDLSAVTLHQAQLEPQRKPLVNNRSKSKAPVWKQQIHLSTKWAQLLWQATSQVRPAIGAKTHQLTAQLSPFYTLSWQIYEIPVKMLQPASRFASPLLLQHVSLTPPYDQHLVCCRSWLLCYEELLCCPSCTVQSAILSIQASMFFCSPH